MTRGRVRCKSHTAASTPLCAGRLLLALALTASTPACSLIGARAPAHAALDRPHDKPGPACSSSVWLPVLDAVGLAATSLALGFGIAEESSAVIASAAGGTAILTASTAYGFHAHEACAELGAARAGAESAGGSGSARATGAGTGTGTGTGTGAGAGAGAGATAAAGGLPVLRVGTSGDYAPFSKAGAGFDVEVAKRMAADLGFRIEWVAFTWPELRSQVAADAFDVGMSGITWRPERSVVGEMSRAVAIGGPCVLSRRPPGTVAVNRGGILEQWAREKFAAAQIRVVDDNLALPRLLAQGEVDAIVTDSFELAHFARPEFSAQCEPARDRKVYWVSPGRAAELAPRIDAWLLEHEPQLGALRAQWFGRETSWTPVEHLIDLLARRLALMPAVAAYKRARGLPIEDAAREAVVLQQAIDEAAAVGLAPESVRALFAEQIALAKAVQMRPGAGASAAAEPLDLDTVLRPALTRLGERILSALASCARELPQLRAEQLDLLAPMLNADERKRLLDALRAVRVRDP